jgi:hypothetical protein
MIPCVRIAGKTIPYGGQNRMEPRPILRALLTVILVAVIFLVATLVVGIAVMGSVVIAAPMHGQPATTAPDLDLERPPSWSIPSYADVRMRVIEWLDAKVAAGTATVADVAAARDTWPEQQAADEWVDLLDHVIDSLSRIDPRCAALRRTAAAGRVAVEPAPADVGWLADAATDVFERDAVRLWLGRERVRCDRFDEGLALLADLDPATAVDPASLLFHRAACQHWLLEADVAVESLDRLLERAGDIPVRYERVARLLRADIAALEDESLDHIARRMRDITRRLDLGRAGPKTMAVQDGVIDSLDKMIKQIEQQQQQQQSQSSSGAGGGGRSGNGTPMDDSRIAGGKGPGEVTKRDIGDADGWGKLPPHKREEAMQQIGREFPAHYREAIEQYFKRLASGEEKR